MPRITKFLAPVEDCEEESRAYQAISTPNIDEIAKYRMKSPYFMAKYYSYEGKQVGQ